MGMQFNKNATDRAKEDIKAALKTLNDHLLTRTFLVGERVTLADIAVACTMISLHKQVLDPAFRKPFGNVTRWFNTVVNQPDAKAVLGQVELCTKMAEFDAKKFAEFSGKGDNKKGKGEKKKEEKKKAEPKPKQEKKKPEPKEEDDELGLALPAKKEDPLDELPKGSFDLEEWKRFFSNNDEEEAVKWFWEHFDTENYSIWKGDYNYNDELTLTFMSANLIGGMFQRLEKMKKNAFASACLFGENNNSSISGVWIWKGQNLAFELSEDWQIDYASYTWRKLDPASEECKKLVHQYWVWEGADDKGRAFNQGKILK